MKLESKGIVPVSEVTAEPWNSSFSRRSKFSLKILPIHPSGEPNQHVKSTYNILILIPGSRSDIAKSWVHLGNAESEVTD